MYECIHTFLRFIVYIYTTIEPWFKSRVDGKLISSHTWLLLKQTLNEIHTAGREKEDENERDLM